MVIYMDDRYTGQTGDPLHDAVYGWDYGSDDDFEVKRESPEEKRKKRRAKRNKYSKKAWQYYMDFNDEEALKYINRALNLDKKHSKNWNKKGIILESLKRFEESEECYNKSLELSHSDIVYDNRARMLYDWAEELIRQASFGGDVLKNLEEAKEKNTKAIEAVYSPDSKENINKYHMQERKIINLIDREKEFLKNIEILITSDKSKLFTITGRDYYNNNIHLTKNMPLKLVRDPYNKSDRDAIEVYAEGEKIGYVANDEHTKYPMTSSASELINAVSNTAEGYFLFDLTRDSVNVFAIGRLIK